MARAVNGRPRAIRARSIAMACFAACSLGLVDVRADESTGVSAAPAGSNATQCAQYGRPRPAQAAPRAGGPAADSLLDVRGVADIPVWKTIAIGTHDSARSLREALDKAGCRTGQLANQVLALPAFTLSAAKADIDLVVLSVGQLGFEAEGASYAEIHARARQLGLELCPAEVAPQLRLQYLDQPLGEFLHIAMEPLVAASGDPVALSVGNGGAGLLLIGFDAHPAFTVSSPLRFVFVRPR
jgi:hypothetical protein